jgi:hypothetical protein
LLDAAEFAARGMARFFRTHATTKVFFFEQLQVSSDFNVEITLISRFG